VLKKASNLLLKNIVAK